MTKLAAYGFVLVTILFTVLGQIIIKWQAAQMSGFPAGWSARLTFFLGAMLNPWIVSGLACAVVAACAWILAMTKLPISVAYPMMSLTYPLVMLISWQLLGETLSTGRVLGVLLILAGVALLGTR